MSAKDRKQRKLLEYLAEPENPWPRTRKEYEGIFGQARRNVYRDLGGAEEIAKVEAEAYEIRKTRLAKQSALVDDAIFRAAVDEGNVKAMKLWKQVREGWGEKQHHEMSGGLTVEVVNYADSEPDE